MMPVLIHILITCAAAFFKSVADTCAHHYSTSVFRFRDPRFWNAEISGQYSHRLRFTSYPVDAWHLSTSGCLCMLFTLPAAELFFPLPIPTIWWVWVLVYIVYGTLFIQVFNLFYNKLLIIKK